MARNDIVVLHVKLSRLELAETAQDWDSPFLFPFQARRILNSSTKILSYYNYIFSLIQHYSKVLAKGPSFQMGPVSYAFILFHSYTKLCSFDVIWIESWFMNSSKTSICCVQNIQSVHDTRD